MPITNYPFVLQGGKPRAALPVTLENPDNRKTFLTWALIDTGADNIVVPGFIAQQLGHNIDHESVRKEECTGISGSSHTFYHSFRISILKLNKNAVVLSDPAIKISKREFAVSQSLSMMLLGVNDFLVKYVLSINYPKKVFSVKSS